MPKVSCRDIFAGFQSIFFKNKLTYMKKAVLHTTTLMHCKARQVLRDLFGTTKGNGSVMTFVAGATNNRFKNLKTVL